MTDFKGVEPRMTPRLDNYQLRTQTLRYGKICQELLMGGQKPVSYSTPKIKRALKMAKARGVAMKSVEQLRKEGYKVKTGGLDGAYYAVQGGTHTQHEVDVCSIAAKNGFSMSLDAEGNVKVVAKDGSTFRAKSLDGTIEGFTQEISALKGKPNIGKVADAIEHSYKMNKLGSKQADVAITITPKGSLYHTPHIIAGIKEHNRRASEGETQAHPRAYLHIDEGTGKVYLYKVKGRKR